MMIRRAVVIVVALLAIGLGACATGDLEQENQNQVEEENGQEVEETVEVVPAPSRPPAPDVPPVEHNGIRYSQVMNGRARNLDQSTGYLLAEDTATGEELWVLKVYDVKTHPALEQDVQEIYFGSMILDPESNSLLIEREFGGTFRLDLEKHTVVALTE